MPAFVAGIHALLSESRSKDVDGRDKPGHDGYNYGFNNTFPIACRPERRSNAFVTSAKE